MVQKYEMGQESLSKLLLAGWCYGWDLEISSCNTGDKVVYRGFGIAIER